MKKWIHWHLAVLSAIFGLIYSIFAWTGSDDLSNVIAPFCTLFAGLALVAATGKAQGVMRKIWLLGGLASLGLMAGDILWAYIDLVIEADPGESVLQTAVYALPNFLLAAAAVMPLGACRKNWLRVQLTVDVFAVSSISLTMLWIIFLNKNFNALFAMDLISIIMFSYAVADFFILGCLIIGIARQGWRLIPLSLRFFIAGLLLFTSVDTVYAYQYFNDIYLPNSALDILYLLSFVMMAFGGSQKAQAFEQSAIEEQDILHGKKFRISPTLLMIILQMILIVINAFNWREFLFMLAILAIHQIISGNIRSTRIYEKLLQHEKQMNQLLEEQITVRTKELVDMNKELELASNHDSITSFYNRRYFMQAFERLLAETRSPEVVVLLFADLDRFKTINDTFGHDTGDQVLVAISKRMKSWNKYQAIIARLGGDEFVLALRGCLQMQDVSDLADELIRCCSEPLNIPPYQFHVTMSLGITIYPYDATERSTLLKNADLAMYHAKAQGRNQYVHFSSLSGVPDDQVLLYAVDVPDATVGNS